jgi:hypothetical protein
VSDHNPLDLIALAGKDARIAELNGCIAELEDECHTWADRMAASETANLNRIAELTNLLREAREVGICNGYSCCIDMVNGSGRHASDCEVAPLLASIDTVLNAEPMP